jgi:hypothetical protein
LKLPWPELDRFGIEGCLNFYIASATKLAAGCAEPPLSQSKEQSIGDEQNNKECTHVTNVMSAVRFRQALVNLWSSFHQLSAC